MKKINSKFNFIDFYKKKCSLMFSLLSERYERFCVSYSIQKLAMTIFIRLRRIEVQKV